MKKYFGKEHYCPLSLLRVFGMTEVEEFEILDEDEDNEASSTATADSTVKSPEPSEKNPENSGIFQTAKDAVVEIVHNVAKKFTKNGEEDAEKLINTANKLGIVTHLSEKDFESLDHPDFIMRCIEQTSYIGYNSSINPFCLFGLTYVLGKQMCPSLSSYHSQNKRKNSKNVMHILPPNDIYRETMESYSVSPIPTPPTVIEKTHHIDTINNTKSEVEDSGTSIEEEKLARKPFTTSTADSTNLPMSVEGQPSITKTLEEEVHNDLVTTTDFQTAEKTCSTKSVPSVDVNHILEIQTSFSEFSTTMSTMSSSTSTAPLQETVEQTSSLSVSTSTETPSSPSLQATAGVVNEESVDVLEFNTNNTVNQVITAEKATIDERVDSMSSLTTKTSSSAMSEQTMHSVSGSESKINSENIAEENIQKVAVVVSSKTATTETLKNLSMNHVIEPSPSTQITDVSAKQIKSDSISPTVSVVVTSSSIVDTLLPPEPTTPTITQPDPPTPQDPTPPITNEKSTTKSNVKGQTNGIPGSKESIIVKLNAKVKALQSNLTMSMMYLEEMSER